MKKGIVLLILVSLAALAFAGGDQEAAEPEAAMPAEDYSDLPAWKQPMAETTTLRAVIGYDAQTDEDRVGITPENQSLVALLREKLNIDLEFMWTVPTDRFEERLSLTLASGNLPHVLRTDVNKFYELADAGQLVDLGDAYDQFASPLLKSNYAGSDAVALENVTVGGELLSIPSILLNSESLAMYYYRQDWLESLGLEPPQNADEVAEIAMALATQDPDGNGEDDTIGLAGNGEYLEGSFGLRGFFMSYGAYPLSWIENDGELVNGTVQPEIKVALDELRALYAAGGLSREFATLNWNQISQRALAGDVGSFYGPWWIPAWPLAQHIDSEPEAEWVSVPIPSDASGEGIGQGLVPRNIIDAYNVVTTAAPENGPEAAVKLLSLWYDISYGGDPVPYYGEQALPDNGWIYNYSPIYAFMGRNNPMVKARVEEAIETGSTDVLTSQHQRNVYNAAIKYLSLELPVADVTSAAPTDGEAWGLWYSRVADDGGIGLAESLVADGHVVFDEFYGPPTPAERRVASTLRDMTLQFVNNYIMGQVPESAWDEFVADWKNLGGDEWTREVNEQYSNLVSN